MARKMWNNEVRQAKKKVTSIGNSPRTRYNSKKTKNKKKTRGQG
jgi:hypothetical protein